MPTSSDTWSGANTVTGDSATAWPSAHHGRRWLPASARCSAPGPMDGVPGATTAPVHHRLVPLNETSQPIEDYMTALTMSPADFSWLPRMQTRPWPVLDTRYSHRVAEATSATAGTTPLTRLIHDSTFTGERQPICQRRGQDQPAVSRPAVFVSNLAERNPKTAADEPSWIRRKIQES